MFAAPRAATLIVRCQVLNPVFSIAMVCSPAGSWRLDGVLPTNLLSIRMSAAVGVELIFTVATSEEIALDGGKTVADMENFAGSRGVSAAMYAVISVPLGIVMSLPCM